MNPSKRPCLLAVHGVGDRCAMAGAVDSALTVGFDGVEYTPNQGEQDAVATCIHASGNETRDDRVTAIAYRIAATGAAKAVDELAALQILAAHQNVSCINLTLPLLEPSASNPGYHSYQDALNLAYELLRAGRFAAERSGIPIALTGATGPCLQSPVELREMIDRINSWSIGVCVDVETVGLVGRPDDWLSILGRRVISVRVTVGSATLDESKRASLKEAAAALDAIEFTGLVVAAGEGDPSKMLARLSRYGFRSSPE